MWPSFIGLLTYLVGIMRLDNLVIPRIRMIYIVLGMHKSGTSLTAQLLSHAGINMGFDLQPGDGDYEKEKCEGRLLRSVNKALLSCGDTHSLNIRIPATLNRTSQTEIDTRHLIEKQGKYPNWGMKDPRLVHTYSYWIGKLPAHKIIFVYRDPVRVADHYTRKNKSGRRFKKALRTWKEYNLTILKIMKDTPREDYICIQYEALMQGNSELQRLSRFIGKPIADLRVYPDGRTDVNNYQKTMTCFLSGCYLLKFRLDARRRAQTCHY